MLHLKLINHILTDQPRDKRGYLIERNHIDSLIQLANIVYVAFIDSHNPKKDADPDSHTPTLRGITQDLKMPVQFLAADVIKPWLAESIADLIDSKKEAKGAAYHQYATNLVNWYYHQYNGVNEELQNLQRMITAVTKPTEPEEEVDKETV